MDDVNEYISGFVVEDIHQLIAGHKLLEFETERHEYDLLNRFMPLEACIVSLKEVNTQR